MIKIFRNIRKKLLEQGPSESSRARKTANYLKYAIGEIVLEMIGILKTRPDRDEIWVEKQKRISILRALRPARPASGYDILCT